ncbi:MAG: nitroreductase family protein [bacterium]|nr:nitroreductase family protein [bacterium]
MTMNFIVDEEKCIHCGMCIKDCSVNVLEFNENRVPYPEHEERCFKCQHCFAICPTGAISIFGKKPENSSPTQNNYNSEEILNLIKDRKSVRQYQQKNIDKETFDKLKEMLKYIPTGTNSRGLHFSFIEDVEKMNEVRKNIYSELIKHSEQDERLRQSFGWAINGYKSGKDTLFRTAPHIVVVSNAKTASCQDADPIIALSYFELYAKSLNLGTCWNHATMWCLRSIPELQKLFDIPETHNIGGAMLFGIPSVGYKRSTQPDDYLIHTVK